MTGRSAPASPRRPSTSVCGWWTVPLMAPMTAAVVSRRTHPVKRTAPGRHPCPLFRRPDLRRRTPASMRPATPLPSSRQPSPGRASLGRSAHVGEQSHQLRAARRYGTCSSSWPSIWSRSKATKCVGISWARRVAGKAGRGEAAGDGLPLKRLERHPPLGPHSRLAVEEQAVGQVRGRAHELREAALEEAAASGLHKQRAKRRPRREDDRPVAVLRVGATLGTHPMR